MLLKKRLEYLMADRTLQQRTALSIADTLGRLSRRWLDRGYSFRRQAVRRLVERSFFTQVMASRLMDGLFRELLPDKLRRLLKAELGDPRVLDDFRPDRVTGHRHRAYGPRLITHVFASNVPNPAIMSFVFGMLVKSANIGKVSHRDAGFLDIYLESLRAFDRRLGRANDLIGPGSRQSAVDCFQYSDLVVAYGSDETLRTLKRSVPDHVAFVGYGHRASIGLYTREALTQESGERLAKAAAFDIWMLDQRGCLSPWVLYLEKGGELLPAVFSSMVAQELQKLYREDGLRWAGVERAAGFELIKSAYQIRSLKDSRSLYWESKPPGRWLVLYDEKAGDLPLSSGQQVIYIKAFGRLDPVFKTLGPLRRNLQAVSLEAFGVRREKLAAGLSRLGFNRICRAGRMQLVPLTWHHDGRANLASWVRWTDLE